MLRYWFRRPRVLSNPWLRQDGDDFGITAFPSTHSPMTVAAKKQQSDTADNRDRRTVRYFQKWVSFALPFRSFLFRLNLLNSPFFLGSKSDNEDIC